MTNKIPTDNLWIVGEHYHSTAGETLDRIAERINNNIANLQTDDLLPPNHIHATHSHPDTITITTTGVTLRDEHDEVSRTLLDVSGHYNAFSPRDSFRRFITMLTFLDDDLSPLSVSMTIKADHITAVDPRSSIIITP